MDFIVTLGALCTVAMLVIDICRLIGGNYR